MIYEDLPIEDDDNLFDPIAVSRDAHDQSLLEMKEALLHAYNTRKAEILPKAV